MTTHEIATLGSGCFWCTEAIFLDLKGVTKVTSGYAGGATSNPSYEQVCSGTTGHAEVVQIEFDPAVISYAQLLEVFFLTHNPTTLNRQGNDVGTQYRSVILYHDGQQKLVAEAVLKKIDAEKIYNVPIVTTIEALKNFYPAEEYHQQYFSKNPEQPYCQVIIDPKIAAFRKKFSHLRKS